ncbi:MAG: hypothetical protein P8X78_05700, partial [Nitrosopumilaceae archaeon]
MTCPVFVTVTTRLLIYHVMQGITRTDHSNESVHSHVRTITCCLVWLNGFYRAPVVVVIFFLAIVVE